MIRQEGQPAKYGSLCLTTATEAEAALLLRRGVVIDYGFYYATPYKEDKRPRICHRCQTWGHRARNCRKPPRCAHCSGAHNNQDCNTPQEERRCANCREKHPAYSHTCSFYHTYLTEYRAANSSGRRPPPTRPDLVSIQAPQLPPLTPIR
jgi:hypothetical protein